MVCVRADGRSSHSIQDLRIHAGQFPAAQRRGGPASILTTWPEHESNTGSLLRRRVELLCPELGLANPLGEKETGPGDFRGRHHVVAHLPRHPPNIPRHHPWSGHQRDYEPALQGHRAIGLLPGAFHRQGKLCSIGDPHPDTKNERVPPRVACGSQAPNYPIICSMLPESIQLPRRKRSSGLARDVPIPNTKPLVSMKSSAMDQCVIAVEVHSSIVLESPGVFQALVHRLKRGHGALPSAAGAMVPDGG
mmetsp:Transcript_74994/g.171917  ORF Transcript_74994/g.171917 Transcript_74994/m.171917 type:complete len:249 (+) Transcript_74994:676-1422(+)